MILKTTNGVLPNVWLGVSAEDQARADERLPDLLATPAAVRFLSYEPALGPLDLVSPLYTGEGGVTLQGYLRDHDEADDFHFWARKLDWVIVGGENGDRPMHPDWARQVRDQCAKARTPFFFKQWGSWATVYDRDRDDPDWRRCPTAEHNGVRYLNLEGGHGFHGERVVFTQKVGKAAAGRELDGRTHDDMPGARP